MSDDDYRDQDRRYEDRQYDDRRRREAQSHRSSEMMDALRQQDYDTAMRNAAPDLYLDYLQQRDAAAATYQAQAPETPSEVLLLNQHQELTNYVQQNIANEAIRVELLRMLAFITPWAPGASEQMAALGYFAQMAVNLQSAGL
jgi:hypothetical protein